MKPAKFGRRLKRNSDTCKLLRQLCARLERIETDIVELRDQLVSQAVTREWYSPAEAAKALGKAEFTVREWCRNGRMKAAKKKSGRGNTLEWAIPRMELDRYRREGLLPLTKDRLKGPNLLVG